MQKEKLLSLAQQLVDQNTARIIIPASQKGSGYWFGGGNIIEHNGALYLCGRYRNYGDSRSGIAVGERGLELAIFRSGDSGKTWQKVKSFSKADLNLPDKEVLSIEGTALHLYGKEIELFISTEKNYNPLPDKLKSFQKQGTGNWSIERMSAPTVEDLDPANLVTVASSLDPRYIHVKDPFLYDLPNGDSILFCCTHPFTWSSSNTAYFLRKKGSDGNSFGNVVWEFMGRGLTWDVAIRRATSLLRIPQKGSFTGENIALLFYDGGESVRQMEEHNNAVNRPRGYSCEELGAVGFIRDDLPQSFESLCPYFPAFLSPHGTACSRYVDTFVGKDGIYVTWQQSQEDFSQPLVMNFVTWDDVYKILI